MSKPSTRSKALDKALDAEMEQETGACASSPLNRVAVRRLILKRLEKKRPYLARQLTRVSENSFSFLESRLTVIIDIHIDAHPTAGATVRIGGR